MQYCKLSKRWLAQLSGTQLKAFVSGACLQSKRFFLALFSRITFFAWSRHFKELQLKGNLIDRPQIWTVAGLTYKNKSVSANYLFRNITSPKWVPGIGSPAAKSVMESASTRTFQCSGYCRRHSKGVPTSAYPRRRPRCAAFSLDHQRVSWASAYPAIHMSSVWPEAITFPPRRGNSALPQHLSTWLPWCCNKDGAGSVCDLLMRDQTVEKAWKIKTTSTEIFGKASFKL